MSARFYAAVIGVFVLLVIVTALTLPLSGAIPALSIRSADPDGSMALDQWLAASGYPVQEVTSLTNQLDRVNLLFILNPIYESSEQDAAQLRSWVRQGNTLSGARASELLLAHMPRLAPQHLPLLVTIRDPILDQEAGQMPTTSDAVYRRAVAEQLIDERRLLLNHLQRQGVFTLDVDAQHLSADVINRYLELKKRVFA